MLPKDIAPASFRGVRFLVPKDSVSEGRNAIDHLYPDSNHRFAEDNGYAPPEFTVTAILHGRGLPGQVSALRNALNRPGPGTLKHPWFGSQLVQVAGPYKITREDTNAGVIEFEIKFLVTGAPILPGLVSGIAAVVSGLASSAIAAIAAQFAAAFPSLPSTLTRRAVSAALSSVLSPLDATAGSAASGRLLVEADGLSDNGARAGALLKRAFRDPFENDSLTADRLAGAFRAASDGAGLAVADAAAINATTRDLAERQAAINMLGVLAEAAAFAALAEALAAKSYATADEVMADEDDFVARYDTLQSRVLPDDIAAQMGEIFIATSDILRSAAVRLPRITEEDVILMPASVLAYTMYETDRELQRIVDLNVGRNPMLYHGPVNVLSIEG